MLEANQEIQNIEQVDFKLVNVEMADLNYYGIEIENDKMAIEVNFKPYLVNETEIEIFYHIRYALENDKGKMIKSLFHVDFISNFIVEKKEILSVSNKNYFIDSNLFAAYLDMTTVMIRGYIVSITKGTPLEEIFFPFIKGTEMIAESDFYVDDQIKLIIEEVPS